MKKMLKSLSVLVLALAVCVTMFNAPTKAATKKTEVTYSGFKFELYDDEPYGTYDSIILAGYTGSETNVTLPTHIIYEGKKYPVTGIGEKAFNGNSKIKKVIIPDGYEYIAAEAFESCSNLTEINISGTVQYIGLKVFANDSNLKTYRIGGKNDDKDIYANSYLGCNSAQDPFPNVSVYCIKGSAADKYVGDVNAGTPKYELTVFYEANPAPATKVTRVLPESTEPANPYEKGASFDRANNAITNFASEGDPAGSEFGLLQLKQKKVTKKSIKVSWKKVSGAVKYAYYAANCGKKNKYKRQGITTGTSFNCKKISGKKLKKGKYCKFIVIAIDKDNKVVSTSKSVHVATKGGKVTNDTKVKVKKTKASVKVGKTYKIKAKEVKPKKGKVKRHRAVKYESLNTTVATVSGKGSVKGVKKGTTTVYAYAQNGVAAKVKITVK